MVRIWRVSGKELPAISVEDLSGERILKRSRTSREGNEITDTLRPDVGGLKRELCRLHGFPLCQQDLLHEGKRLENSTKLDDSMDLQLVFLPLATDVLQREAANEFLDACMNGDKRTAQSLLDAGVDKDVRRHDNYYTGLMLAAINGNLDIAQMLLEVGADKEMQDYLGETALINAAREGYAGIVRLLLEAGADKDFQTRFGKTALSIAREGGQEQIVELLSDPA